MKLLGIMLCKLAILTCELLFLKKEKEKSELIM